MMQYKNFGKNPVKNNIDLGNKRRTRADDDFEDEDEPDLQSEADPFAAFGQGD